MRRATLYSASLLMVCSMAALSLAEETLLEKARQAIEDGKYLEAKSLLKDQGKNQDAAYLLGLTYLFLSEEPLAQEVFRKISDDPLKVAQLEDLAYFEAGSRWIKTPGKRHIGMHYLNRSVQRNANRKESASRLLYENGEKAIPENRWLAHQILGRALEFNASLESEDRFFAAYAVESSTKPPETIQGGETFLKRFPDSPLVPQVLYDTAEAYLADGKKKQAKEHFKKLIEHFPDSPLSSKAKPYLP